MRLRLEDSQGLRISVEVGASDTWDKFSQNLASLYPHAIFAATHWLKPRVVQESNMVKNPARHTRSASRMCAFRSRRKIGASSRLASTSSSHHCHPTGSATTPLLLAASPKSCRYSARCESAFRTVARSNAAHPALGVTGTSHCRQDTDALEDLELRATYEGNLGPEPQVPPLTPPRILTKASCGIRDTLL